MLAEIGDKFIINWKEIRNRYPSVRPCNFPDMEFTINSFRSKISIYYLDNRTNKKCKCQQCDTPSSIRGIGILDIIITQKKLSFDRDRKLKQLGI